MNNFPTSQLGLGPALIKVELNLGVFYPYNTKRLQIEYAVILLADLYILYQVNTIESTVEWSYLDLVRFCLQR